MKKDTIGVFLEAFKEVRLSVGEDYIVYSHIYGKKREHAVSVSGQRQRISLSYYGKPFVIDRAVFMWLWYHRKRLPDNHIIVQEDGNLDNYAKENLKLEACNAQIEVEGRSKSLVQRYYKLTDALVIQLRKEFAESGGNKKLIGEFAKKYNVAPGTIRAAIIGEAFKHLPGAVAYDKRPNVSVLTDADIVDIRAYASDPENRGKVKIKDIAKKYNVAYGSIYLALLGRTFKHIPGELKTLDGICAPRKSTDAKTRYQRRKPAANGLRNQRIDARPIEEIVAMRTEYRDTIITVSALAKKHGMSSVSMLRLLRGDSYSYVPDPITNASEINQQRISAAPKRTYVRKPPSSGPSDAAKQKRKEYDSRRAAAKRSAKQIAKAAQQQGIEIADEALNSEYEPKVYKKAKRPSGLLSKVTDIPIPRLPRDRETNFRHIKRWRPPVVGPSLLSEYDIPEGYRIIPMHKVYQRLMSR